MVLIENEIKPLTKGQEKLIKALRDRESRIIGVFGPTGTGKSLLTVCFGYDAILGGLYERIVYAKPIIDVATGKEIAMQEIGERFREILREHLSDLFMGLIDKGEIENLLKEGKLQLSDTHYIRGRTFDKTFLILDDAQNTTIDAIIESISRLGRESKLIIIGDPIFQSSMNADNPVLVIRSLLLREPEAMVIDLGLRDIVRPGAKKALKLLLEFRMRKRNMSENEKKVKQTYELIAPDVDIVTIIDTKIMKNRIGLSESVSAPDYLIVVKEGHYGRAVGKNGDRINKVEKELGIKARVTEASLDFLDLIKAIHPSPRAISKVREIDLQGGDLVLYVEPNYAGPIFGQKGVYIRFLEAVLQQMLGVGIIVKEES